MAFNSNWIFLSLLFLSLVARLSYSGEKPSQLPVNHPVQALRPSVPNRKIANTQVVFPHTTPLPKPVQPPKPIFKKGERVVMHPQSPLPKSIEVYPGPIIHNLSKIEGETFFELFQDKNQLFLHFRSLDPALHLSQEKPVVVDLHAELPLTVEPSLVTTEEWKKGTQKLLIHTSGARPGKTYRIIGTAAYTYCHLKTKACTPGKTKIVYIYEQ